MSGDEPWEAEGNDAEAKEPDRSIDEDEDASGGESGESLIDDLAGGVESLHEVRLTAMLHQVVRWVCGICTLTIGAVTRGTNGY